MHDVNKLNALVPRYTIHNNKQKAKHVPVIWNINLLLLQLSIQTLLPIGKNSEPTFWQNLCWLEQGAHCLCRPALERICTNSILPSLSETAFVKWIQLCTRKYADKNCTGDSTTDSQTKKHGQEKCLSLDECFAAHFKTSANSRFGHPKTENTKQANFVAKIVLALPDGASSHMHEGSNMRWVAKATP